MHHSFALAVEARASPTLQTRSAPELAFLTSILTQTDAWHMAERKELSLRKRALLSQLTLGSDFIFLVSAIFFKIGKSGLVNRSLCNHEFRSPEHMQKSWVWWPASITPVLRGGQTGSSLEFTGQPTLVNQ